jgi:hypothetical protein
LPERSNCEARFGSSPAGIGILQEVDARAVREFIIVEAVADNVDKTWIVIVSDTRLRDWIWGTKYRSGSMIEPPKGRLIPLTQVRLYVVGWAAKPSRSVFLDFLG